MENYKFIEYSVKSSAELNLSEVIMNNELNLQIDIKHDALKAINYLKESLTEQTKNEIDEYWSLQYERSSLLASGNYDNEDIQQMDEKIKELHLKNFLHLIPHNY